MTSAISSISRASRRRDRIDQIVHLAAEPGVRYSMIGSYIYDRTHVMGHLVMLEIARDLKKPRHFNYASSSSIYGGNRRLPFAVADLVDHPVSLNDATERADELMTETYTHLYGLKATGLCFFTVYGPWGRPDMSLERRSIRGIGGDRLRCRQGSGVAPHDSLRPRSCPIRSPALLPVTTPVSRHEAGRPIFCRARLLS